MRAIFIEGEAWIPAIYAVVFLGCLIYGIVGHPANKAGAIVSASAAFVFFAVSTYLCVRNWRRER